MTYTSHYAQAVQLFKRGEFEASLHEFRDLLHKSRHLTTAQHFDLLNYMTNCQVNLGLFDAAYEHLELLNQLAQQLQTPEALYYTAMKRAIVAARNGGTDVDTLFAHVFQYAKQTGKLSHLCDTTGNYLYYLLSKKRYEAALDVVNAYMPPFDDILNEAPVSMRTLFPSAAETYFFCGQYEQLKVIVAFFKQHMHAPVVQSFHEIYYEMNRYVALVSENEPLFLEMIDAELQVRTQRDEHRQMIQLLQKQIAYAQAANRTQLGIELAERLLEVYQTQGILTQKEKLSKETRGYVNLKKAAIHDQLTGLYNRRYLYDYQMPTQLSVAFFDIDRFKQINDTYGHKAGDAVLQKIGHILQAFCPNYVKAVRYGGDEFNLLLEIEPQQAELFIDQLFTSMKTLYIDTGKGGLTVHLSMGYAVKNDEDTLDTLLKRADEALYMAKRNGRNQLVKSR